MARTTRSIAMLSQLYWQQPWWLLLAIAPWLLSLIPAQRSSQSRLNNFIARHLWPQLLTGQSNNQQRWGTRPFLAAWILSIIAIAGPMLEQPSTIVAPPSANIVVILDISPSMGVTDASPNRLEHAKRLLTEFVQSLKNDRLALVGFSANAYTILPLTSDRQSFNHFLNILDPSLVKIVGSNLSKALLLADEALAAPSLKQDDPLNGLALLISDGEIHDQSALKAARQLNSNGHQLFTLGVGTEAGGPVPLAKGRFARKHDTLVNSQRQRSTLQALAQAGGGHYHDLAPTAWPALMAAIAKLKQSSEIKSEKIGLPLYPWLLLFALVLFLWNGLRRPEAIAAILLPVLFLQSPVSDAAPWDENKARNHLKQNQNEQAKAIYNQLDNFNSTLGQGVAAYQLNNWSESLAAFEHAYQLAQGNKQKAFAAYNQGNVLAQQGKLKEASKAYENALKWQSNYPKAKLNMGLVQHYLQQWGGQNKGDSQIKRRGISSEEDQEVRGGGQSKQKQTATKERKGTPQENKTQQHQADKKSENEALKQTLRQWQELDNTNGQVPLRAQQQFRALQENNKAMLKRRFAIEDGQAIGLVRSKPW